MLQNKQKLSLPWGIKSTLLSLPWEVLRRQRLLPLQSPDSGVPAAANPVRFPHRRQSPLLSVLPLGLWPCCPIYLAYSAPPIASSFRLPPPSAWRQAPAHPPPTSSLAPPGWLASTLASPLSSLCSYDVGRAFLPASQPPHPHYLTMAWKVGTGPVSPTASRAQHCSWHTGCFTNNC